LLQHFCLFFAGAKIFITEFRDLLFAGVLSLLLDNLVFDDVLFILEQVDLLGLQQLPSEGVVLGEGAQIVGDAKRMALWVPGVFDIYCLHFAIFYLSYDLIDFF
jgi:hypothetical protein